MARRSRRSIIYGRARRYGGRARRYGGRAKRYGRRLAGSNKFITMLTGTGSFVQQITEKDFTDAAKQNIWANPTTKGLMYKLKFIAQHTIFRLSGMRIFDDVWLMPPANQGVKVNPGGILNKWTGLGILMTLIIPKIPKLPYKGKMRAAGAGMLFGGIMGGLFDDPMERTSAPSAVRGPSVAYNPSVWSA